MVSLPRINVSIVSFCFTVSEHDIKLLLDAKVIQVGPTCQALWNFFLAMNMLSRHDVVARCCPLESSLSKQ